MKIRGIGDVHDKVQDYQMLAGKADYSIQVGDWSVDVGKYDQMKLSAATYPPEKHVVLLGNHDNYDKARNYDFVLDDYGVWNEIFYYRGADSFNKQMQLAREKADGRKRWWEEEELSESEMEQCLTAYEEAKPDILISHDGPQFIVEKFLKVKNESRTRLFGNRLYEIHRPKLHLIGHHHQSLDVQIENTRFMCLDILEYHDFEV